MILLYSAIIILIIFLIVTAFHSGLELRFLLLVTSGYWFLNFIISPMIASLSCTSGIWTVATDNRVCGNNHLVKEALLAVATGCLFFLITMRKLSKSTRKGRYLDESYVPVKQTPLLFILFIVGGIALVLELSNWANVVSKSLVSLAAINFSVYLWVRKTSSIPSRVEWFLIILGILEVLFLYSHTYNSKGVILTPILIFVYRLEFWNSGKNKINRVVLFLTLIIAFGFLFNLLQNFKLGVLFDFSGTEEASHFPKYVLYLLPIAQRFDQFPRIVDALLSSTEQFRGFSNWVKEILKSLSWNPSTGRIDSTFGEVWNTQITAQSIPNAKFSKVSLAQGFVADGIIWSGFSSLILESMIFAVLIFVLSKKLAGSLRQVYLAFALISNGALFESGSVAIAALFSGMLKIYLTIRLIEYFLSLFKLKHFTEFT